MDDREDVHRVRLGQTPKRVHLMDDDGRFRAQIPEFLDEEVAEVVVVAREVAHVHGLGEFPCNDGLGRGAVRRVAHGRGWRRGLRLTRHWR